MQYTVLSGLLNNHIVKWMVKDGETREPNENLLRWSGQILISTCHGAVHAVLVKRSEKLPKETKVLNAISRTLLGSSGHDQLQKQKMQRQKMCFGW